MLLSIQFPLADSRAFLDGEVGLLLRPGWPSASPDEDFVRSFGIVKKRKLGGLNGWIGESVVCEACRALRFKQEEVRTYVDEQSSLRVPFRLAFRRFFFDGLAVGKFELGITTRGGTVSSLNGKQTREFINNFLSLQTYVPNPYGEIIKSELWQASRHIARLYAASTTLLSKQPPVKPENWWVERGDPLIFLVEEPQEQLKISFKGHAVPRNEELGVDLSFHEIPPLQQGRPIGMWLLKVGPNSDLRAARSLRICLLRLHAEQECLRLVLKNISENRIVVNPRSDAAERLNEYLNKATRKISRLGSEANTLADGEVTELARALEDFISPGERDDLLNTLSNMKVLRNVFNKVQNWVINGNYIEEQKIMGDKYENRGQVGAQGPNAHVHDIDFNQVYNESGQNIDLDELAKQLATLRAALKDKAAGAEQEIDIGHVAAAEVEAKKKNGGKALEYLSKAGKWVLDTATSIGAKVAVEALKKSVGL